MVFSNTLFLYLFLPINLILYYAVKSRKWKNFILIIFSLAFYAWGEPVWIFLLIFSSLVDYGHGLFIEKYRGTKLAKIGLLSSICINLGLLITFKYSAFLYENLNTIFNLSLEIPKFSLPIGISFYTFQTLSYTVDVYKGDVKAQKNFSKFLMYVSLYHQLVAGPIVRYSDVEEEIESRVITVENFSRGISRFTIGLAKKVLIANVAGQFVTQYMNSDLSSITVLEAWFGIAMFTIQIYFDFSGYSDMAIGLGKMFGFTYMENFNYPYISKSATEFWRRWHISLGSFFRDYVYIPLGGNRKNIIFNLFVVWFLTGIWHGASWNFILWGLYFGILVYLEKKILFRVLNKIPKIFSHIYLIVALLVGWTLFYFTDVNRAFEYIKILFGFTNNEFTNNELKLVFTNNIYWILIAIVASTPIYPYLKQYIGQSRIKIFGQVVEVLLNVVIMICCTSMLIASSYNPFLYFRF
ncbi:alginate O-acetyltransferase [Paraclostridium benzoelyticum]|uniref:Alginate O-acetyltransferase n=1 Tax=Paraclostridium benzoelyticum TaxID=1629550 RepID=A0A0M3DEL2_9FIRM|nr:MBOAT family O-acyltransferase [Paraclostridium benzoelyticum]KKX99821.1 alginate O-acetyltransferase [Paraclostridium benzoelyticum]